jgi:hypothetical protein
MTNFDSRKETVLKVGLVFATKRWLQADKCRTTKPFNKGNCP